MRKNYFLRSVFLLTALLCGSLFGWSQTYEYTGTGMFEKITSVDDLETGYYVITADNKAMQSILNRKINTEVVSFNDDYSVVTDPAIAAVWKIESIGDGKYCLLCSSENYLKYSGNKTNFSTDGGSTSEALSQFEVTYNEGFLFKFTGTNRYILLGITDQFAPYADNNIGASGYTTPQLYKLKTTGGEDLLSPELAFTDITGNITKLLADGSYSSAATSVSDAAIDYSSSNQEVATIDTDGLVTLVAGGTTVIKAEVPQTSVYKAAAVQYTLTVKAPAVIASEVTFNDWSKIQGSGSGYAAYAGDQIFVGSDGKDYTWNFNDVMLSTTPETKGWPQVKKSSGTLVSPAFETENGFTYTITFNGDGNVTLEGSDGETVTGPSPLTFTTKATNCSVTLSNPTATTYIEKIVINASAPAVVTYPLHITLPNSEEGTLRVLNGDTEVTDGENVAENTVLTVVAEPATGYELSRILVNDVALETNVNTFTLTQETTVTAEFEEAVPAYCTYEGNSTHSERYVRSITMNGGTSPFSVSVYSTTRQAVYVDKTDNVFEAYAGEEIQPVVNWAGEWMHGYLYIDYDKDYTFSYTLGSDDYPTADGELVSYTFYSPSDSQWGKNSKGETTENNSRLDDVPSFTLPESLAPGEYRVRLKIDWCHLDPCGHPDEPANTLTANGGNIVDFTLRIVERPATYTVTLPETVENGMLTVMNGSAALVPGANTVEENSELTITAEPAQGYRLESLTVNEETFESGNKYTVTGNTTIAVSFAEIPVESYTMTLNIEGDGTVTVTDSENNTYENGMSIVKGTELTVTFTPGENSILNAASKNSSSIMDQLNEGSYTFVVTENFTITASFVHTYEVTFEVLEGEGTIQVEVDGTSYPSGSRFPKDTQIKTTFIPAENYILQEATITIMESQVDLTNMLENGSITLGLPSQDVYYTAKFAPKPDGIEDNPMESVSARYQAGVLHVEGVTEGGFEVNIYNLTGKLVRTSTETMINVADLAKGCYLVKITTAEAEKTVKFIKK